MTIGVEAPADELVGASAARARLAVSRRRFTRSCRERESSRGRVVAAAVGGEDMLADPIQQEESGEANGEGKPGMRTSVEKRSLTDYEKKRDGKWQLDTTSPSKSFETGWRKR